MHGSRLTEIWMLSSLFRQALPQFEIPYVPELSSLLALPKAFGRFGILLHRRQRRMRNHAVAMDRLLDGTLSSDPVHQDRPHRGG
jgi:hypothetical protein